MAATPIAVTQLSQSPTTTPTPGATDAVNGNICPNSGKTVFRFKNSDTNPHNVTFVPIVTEDGLALQSLPIAVPASGDIEVSGFQVNVFGAQITFNSSDGTHITCSVTEPG